MIEQVGGELHNIDVDLVGLQICALRQRRAGRAMTILCADAENLPYQAGFFDAIVIFASLHHFPNPAKLLDTLRNRLKPTGFIAVMCEPVGHIWPGAVMPEFLAELKRGVNEQSFTAEEYAWMFRAAELATAEAIIDKNSLKARLVPKAASR
jgi:SAM-dependent methyltransferase